MLLQEFPFAKENLFFLTRSVVYLENAMHTFHNILVRSTNWVGDVVMTMPAIKALRGLYPRAAITVLCKPYISDLFQEVAEVDGVLELDGSFRRSYSRVRAARFDSALLLQNAFGAALLAFLARIPVRVGFPTDCRRRLLTHPVQDSYQDCHQSERYLGLVRSLGYQGPAPSPFIATSMDNHRGDRDYLLHLLQRKAGTVPTGRPLIGLAPGAKYGPAKQWGTAPFRELISLLLDKGAGVCLIGAASDTAVAREIGAGFPGDRVVDSSGCLTLMESLYVIGELDALVSNDSGAMHMAAARDTRIFAIFGPTRFQHTAPLSQQAQLFFKQQPCWPCKHRVCPKPRHYCMEAITARQVYEKIVARLNL